MFEESDLIYSYSREDAMEDGVLVDVSDTAREAGFRVPVALTRAVWCRYVEVPEDVDDQDEAGRLWDILYTARFAIRRSDGPEVVYKLHVRNDNRPGDPPLVRLKAVFHMGDTADPVVTIMLPEED